MFFAADSSLQLDLEKKYALYMRTDSVANPKGENLSPHTPDTYRPRLSNINPNLSSYSQSLSPSYAIASILSGSISIRQEQRWVRQV
jgi:hypothetical protein